MTKRFSKTAKPRREPPAELVEWTAAYQEYRDARLAGQMTEAHRAKAREAVICCPLVLPAFPRTEADSRSWGS